MLSIRTGARILTMTAAAFTCAHALAGDGARVLILSGGDTGLDGQVELVLESFGHVATVGPAYNAFSGKIDLGAYDVVYLQANANWSSGDMPAAGQDSLVSFVNAGGGIITSEWVLWLVATSSRLQTLDQVFPAQTSGLYGLTSTTTYSVQTTDPVINVGLPESFEFPLTSFGGTESEILPRPGAALTFYTTTTYPSGAGVVGMAVGNGRVINLSNCTGVASMSDPNFQRLFSNCVDWLGGGTPSCPADFNNDSAVNSQDFFDFLAAFFETDPSADFNSDSTVNSQDFFDFLAAFFGGC